VCSSDLPNATAPAQSVRIEFVFDSGLDLATFKVGLFAFSTFSVNSGYVSNRFQQTVNTTDITGTYVFLQATPSATESKITWVFQTLDASGLPPSDASIGFLPPNNVTSGQGYVTFKTNVRNNIDNLIKIVANATIVFDENPPISTKSIFNTVDNVPPGKVNINATNVQGGVLLQFLAVDVGCGVKYFDLYNVLDVEESPVLIKSDITSTYAIINFGEPPELNGGISENGNIIYLDKHVNYHLTAVATDFVDNSGAVDVTNTVSISAPRNCSSQCSGHGTCIVDECVCDADYYGISCNQSIAAACDLPILDLVYLKETTLNAPVVVHMLASTPQDVTSISIVLLVNVRPTETMLSRGRQRNDLSWYLADSDFGDVAFSMPALYVGYVNFTVQAVLVSNCGTTSRSINASFVVVSNSYSLSTPYTPYVTESDNWSSWSAWTNCTRTCDIGVRVRQRQCLDNSTCVGAKVNIEMCLLSTCPGISIS